MWVKYREKWSYGFSKWEYSFVGDMSFESYVYLKEEESENEWNWSEHYRGCEIEKVEDPPIEVVKEKIEKTKSTIKSYEKQLEELMKYDLSPN